MSGKTPVAQRAGMHRIAAQAAKHGPQTLYVEAASRLARDLEVLRPPCAHAHAYTHTHTRLHNHLHAFSHKHTHTGFHSLGMRSQMTVGLHDYILHAAVVFPSKESCVSHDTDGLQGLEWPFRWKLVM